MHTISLQKYIQLLGASNQHLLNLLSKGFETVGSDSGSTTAVTATWMISFQQVEKQNTLASELLSLLSFFDC